MRAGQPPLGSVVDELGDAATIVALLNEIQR